ncbi:hypothetical protein BD560DRAFT_173227 [Blakeslea trispora]|nr:hypothetical protein BD560DRAFT_173227 [Blakeslea trispora]
MPFQRHLTPVKLLPPRRLILVEVLLQEWQTCKVSKKLTLEEWAVGTTRLCMVHISLVSPRNIMRSLAGFYQQGMFFLPRNTVEPCQALQSKVFPMASVWLEKIHSGHAEQTVAAEGFLRLLLTLRTTFLQDSVFMQNVVPDHPIWQHELFLDPLYLEFKRQLEASAQTEASQEELLLQRVVPLIERQLANSQEIQQQQYEEIRHLQTSILNQIKDIATGRAPLQINIDWPTGSNVPMTTVRSLSSVPSSDEQSHSVVLTSSTRSNVVFRMSNVQTITDLYREWTEGLGGNHSIDYMNEHHPGWYKNQKSFYMRRNKIIKAIKACAIKEYLNLKYK